MAKDLVRTRRYVQKFYQMRTQLQAVSLRIQTLRSNQQMAEAMRGATRVGISLLAASDGADEMTGNGGHESRHEPSSDPANNDGIRKGERNDGHERGNDVRCRRRCYGRGL